MLAGILEKGSPQAMETEPPRVARASKGVAPGRTLSTLESRPMDTMGADTNKFVHKVSLCVCRRGACNIVWYECTGGPQCALPVSTTLVDSCSWSY